MDCKITPLKATLLLTLITPTGRVLANEPAFETTRHAIGGGGTMRSSGGNLELSATIGRPVTGGLSGGGIQLTGGFWFRAVAMDCDADGSVGYVDFRNFVECLLGPADGAATECTCFDTNATASVDLSDFAAFQRAFNDATPPPGDPAFTLVTGIVKLDGADGTPLEGALVELKGHDRSTLTASDGSFLFTNVPTETCIIDVVATATIGKEEVFGAARYVKTLGGGTTDVGVILLSNIVRWVSPNDGLWANGTNWEAFFPPGPGHRTVIDVPDAEITVTHDQTVPFDGPLGDLLCNEKLRLDVFGTLSVAGSFQMHNTLEMAAGTIVDSTIDLSPEGLINILRGPASTLDGVTINGNMDLLDHNLANLRILNGVTINGTVRMKGLNVTTGSRMFFEGPNKFIDGNATISFISNPGSPHIHQNDGGNLHIRSGVTIRGAAGRIGIASAPLVQDALIHSDTSGTIQVNGLDWVNNGTLRVSGSDSVLWTRGSYVNHGTIEASDAGRLILDGTYQNLGTLTAIDADVRLDGEFTIADLGAFNFTNSLVVVEGTLVNESGLALDADQFNWKLGKGTVLGGTISSADGTSFDPVSGIGGGRTTLDGVTLDADMSMSRGTIVDIKNGLTLNGHIRQNAFQSLFALISVLGPNRTIAGTGQVEFLSAGASDNGIFQGSLGGAGDLGVMTIGPDITIFGAAGSVGESGLSFPASIINNGTIHSDRPGTITVKGTDWINNGTLRSSGGGSLVTRSAWTNNGVVHADGGSLSATGTWTNNGTVRLEAGPTLQSSADFSQSSTGTLLSSVRSTAVDGYGKMIVDGTVTLDGVLRVEFEGTYSPAVGDSFAVLQYGNRVGAFASIEVPSLDPGLQIVASYEESFLTIIIQQL